MQVPQYEHYTEDAVADLFASLYREGAIFIVFLLGILYWGFKGKS